MDRSCSGRVASFVVPSSPDECRRAAAVIVPGVGHFAATARLDEETGITPEEVPN